MSARHYIDGQPIFEPFKSGLKAPAEVLRRFFEPLIEEAQERQKRREAHEKLETGGHLIDRLLSTINGESYLQSEADGQVGEGLLTN